MPKMIAGGVTAGVQIGAAYWMGDQLRDAAYDKAKVTSINAARTLMEASDVMDRGRKDADVRRLKGAGDKATARVAQAANNGMVDQDSNLDIVSDIAMYAEMDADIIANNAAREAWGLSTRAADLRAQATAERKAGDNARANSILGGFVDAGKTITSSMPI